MRNLPRLSAAVLVSLLLACGSSEEGGKPAGEQDITDAAGADAAGAPGDDAGETATPDTATPAPDSDWDSGSDASSDDSDPGSDTPGEPPTAPAQVQLVHLLPGSTAMDVHQGSAPLASALGFAQGTAALEVTAAQELTWSEWSTGDPPLLTAPAPPEDSRLTLVLCGSLAEPLAVWVPAPGPPPPGNAHLRVVQAAASLGSVTAALQRGQVILPLGTPSLGERGPAVALDGYPGWEITLSWDGGAAVLPLPELAHGHATDAFIAETPGGDPFVLLLRDDGKVRQIGPPDHATRWRVVNLSASPLSAMIPDEPAPALEGIEPHHSSGIATLWPGTKSVTLTGATTGATVGILPALPLAKGELSTTVAYDAAPGQLAWVTLDDFSGQQTGSNTEIQLVHAAPGLGTVSVYLYYSESSWETPIKSTLSKALGFGQVSQKVFPKKGTYTVGVDADGDGKPEKTFAMGYFPDYGFNLYLARDLDGRLRMGTQPPVETPIWWKYAEEELTSVRITNLTTLDGLVAGLPLVYVPASPEVVGAKDSTNHWSVLAGDVTVSLTDPKTGLSWAWSGALAGGHAYTAVFWEDQDGSVSTLVMDDTIKSDYGVRVAHLAPGLGPVGASWAAGAGAKPVPLGTLSPGDLSNTITSGFSYSKPGRILIDEDGDGVSDLSFTLTQVAGQQATTAYLLEDDTWPYLIVQGGSYLLSESFPEELLTRLRVVYLPDKQAKLSVNLDGQPFQTLTSKPSWGAFGIAFYASTGYAEFPGGEHTLDVTAGGVSLSLAPTLANGTRQTLLVYGPSDAPVMTLLSDDFAAVPGGSAVSVFHAGLGAGAADIYALPAAGAAELLSAGIEYGGEDGPTDLTYTPQAFAIDWNGDAKPDWKSAAGGFAGGHTRVYVTGPPETPMLLPVSDGAYPWLGGDVIK